MTGNVLDWIGRSERQVDILRPQPARFMQATLDRGPSLKPGDDLPPLWHWLYFLDAKPARELGRDAHPKKGGFLPPVALPRRMWAGGRLQFLAPLPLGAEIMKVSTILDVVEKDGRSGRLCFVTVEHRLFQGDDLTLVEEHDIVYREDPDRRAPVAHGIKAPEVFDVSEQVTPTEVMLFRYSALTFNGHRIHYDVDYARDVEGYEGLVFHGPLTATLLVDLAARQTGKLPCRFSFKALAPLAGPAPFDLQARRNADFVTLWARRADGVCAMQATAEF